MRYFGNLALLAFAYLGIVFGIAFRGEITTKAHGDRAGGNFGQARGNDNRGWVRRVAESSRQSGGQRKGNGQSIRHADDDVAHNLTGGEGSFRMWGFRHEPPFVEAKICVGGGI